MTIGHYLATVVVPALAGAPIGLAGLVLLNPRARVRTSASVRCSATRPYGTTAPGPR